MVHNRIHRNDYFFSKWSVDMAYVLGFTTADGCIKDTTELAYIVHENDVDVLEYIKNAMDMDHRIYDHNYGYGFKGSGKYKRLALKSKRMKADLELLNVTPRKTYTITLPPMIPSDMQGHYVRGYFDGDGSISLYNNNKQLTAIVGMKTASEVYAKQLGQLLEGNGIKTKVYNRPSKEMKYVDLYELRVASRSIPDFGDFMYKDAPFYLERKYEKFQALYAGRFDNCLICNTKFYRKRIGGSFCEGCTKLVNNQHVNEIASITGIPSEVIRSACVKENVGSINYASLKELISSYHKKI